MHGVHAGIHRISHFAMAAIKVQNFRLYFLIMIKKGILHFVDVNKLVTRHSAMVHILDYN